MRNAGRFVVFILLVTLAAPASAVAGSDGQRSGAFSPSALGADLAAVAERRGRTASGRPDPASGGAAVAAGAAAPVVSTWWHGISRLGSVHPADPTGAAGSSHVVTAVNTRVAVFDEAGGRVLSPRGLGTLYTFPRGTFVFDPKVVYDPYSAHFTLVYLALNFAREKSWILLVSIPDATAGQPSTWCRRRIRGDASRRDGRQFADYPSVGFDARRVYVSTNQFSFHHGGFDHAQVLAFAKGRLNDCSARLTSSHYAKWAGRATRDPEGTQAFTIQPAVTHSATGRSTVQYMASFQTRCSLCAGRRITLWRVHESRTGLKLSRRSIFVGLARPAFLGGQRNGLTDNHLWDVGDLRLINAFYDADAGRLYTAHTVERNIRDPGDDWIEAGIRWYEIQPAPFSSPTVPRKGIVVSPDRDAGWPSVATDAGGTLFLNFSRAGRDEFLSAVVATIPPGATTSDGEVRLDAPDVQLARFEGIPRSPERWGDYTALSRDPDDGTRVWAVNQYARRDGRGATDRWQQVVMALTAAPPSP